MLSLPTLALSVAVPPEGAARESALAFSSDGRLLAAGGRDCQVVLRDPATGEKLLALPRQESPIQGLAFEPAGQHLAICGIEDQVTVWDLVRVRDQLNRLAIDWVQSAGAKNEPRADAGWPQALADSWRRPTTGPVTQATDDRLGGRAT